MFFRDHFRNHCFFATISETTIILELLEKKGFQNNCLPIFFSSNSDFRVRKKKVFKTTVFRFFFCKFWLSCTKKKRFSKQLSSDSFSANSDFHVRKKKVFKTIVFRFFFCKFWLSCTKKKGFQNNCLPILFLQILTFTYHYKKDKKQFQYFLQQKTHILSRLLFHSPTFKNITEFQTKKKRKTRITYSKSYS